MSPSTPPPPLPRPEEERAGWLLLRHEGELRAGLEGMIASLQDPARQRLVDRAPRSDLVRTRVQALQSALEESLRVLETLRGELTRPAGGERKGGDGDRGPGEDERTAAETLAGSDQGILVDGAWKDVLPPGLVQGLAALRSRRRAAGALSLEVRHDPDRGWILRWRESGTEGQVVASGRLYERSAATLR